MSGDTERRHHLFPSAHMLMIMYTHTHTQNNNHKTNMHIYAHTHTHTHTHAHTLTHIHASTHAHTHTKQQHAHVCTHTHTHTYTNTHTCKHMHTHTQTFTQTSTHRHARTFYLIDPGHTGEQSGFTREFLQPLFVGFHSSERLVKANVDLAEVKECVHHLLLLDGRLELLLCVTVHPQSIHRQAQIQRTWKSMCNVTVYTHSEFWAPV